MLDAETIRLLRLSRRLSQRELGEKIGVSQEKISLLERGLKPTLNEQKALVDVLTQKPEENTAA